MRYAVFSDVHANLEAFRAVLDAFKNLSLDRYLFAGDIVGYGADPCECIAALRHLGATVVAGNHDWAAAGRIEPDRFNDDGKAAVFWTRKKLTDFEKNSLADWPVVTAREDFCLVHGTLEEPGDFGYLIDGDGAIKTFSLLKQKICFLGHSHRPGLFIEREEGVFYKPAQDVTLSSEKRYIINVGSVGQPRDGDPRACFCVFDDRTMTIEFRRVGYDVASAQRKILEAGLPPALARRLAAGS